MDYCSCWRVVLLLQMCSSITKAVGCDGELGSGAMEDDCGVCGGDRSSCRLIRGQTVVHLSKHKVRTVVEVPAGSRFLRFSAKGPDIISLVVESSFGLREEVVLSSSGPLVFGNTSLEVLRRALRLRLKSVTPLGSDFRIKVKYGGPEDTVIYFLFYQPIRFQWRESDFFGCSVSCGRGYQLNSAHCVDIRSNQSVPEQHCLSLSPNSKPSPQLRECGEDECPDSDRAREVTPDEPLQPRRYWEPGPWSRCSAPCGDSGGWQDRSVQCVEMDSRGRQTVLHHSGCGHAPRPITRRICNAFKCPQWVAMEWSQCTVTCGQGLRYRVVLCIDHQGQHVDGCDSALKPHVKQKCVIAVACHKPQELVVVDEREPWIRRSLEQRRSESEEPTFVLGPWSSCSAPCGLGVQSRQLKCQVFLSFTKAEVDLPEEECGSEPPQTHRACSLGPCGGQGLEVIQQHSQTETELYVWDHQDFSDCSASCASGLQTATVRCVSRRHGNEVDASLCHTSRKPPSKTRLCNSQPCPARWEVTAWSSCSASCGVGIQTRGVFCMTLLSVAAGNVATVSKDQCQDLKPSILQPCNQVDCPAYWDTSPWQQCSQSCGGGRQFRAVVCKRLLSSGSYQTLTDSECGQTRPNASRSCADMDCAPYISGGEWTKCSVSCGLGVQRREPQCVQISSSARLVSLSWDRCLGLSSPPLIRTCRMISCPKQLEADAQL